jgi:hypothetical protein
MRCFFCTIIFFQLILFSGSFAKGQMSEQNQTCLECHTSQTFSVYNDWTERDERRLMNPFYILDTVKLAAGVHSNFNCVDCHSMEYETYPHNGELKLEPMMTCIDCHGGDATYSAWQFDEIEEEFHKSVHYEIYGDQFSCSKCHSQHYYRATARMGTSLQEIVQSNNNMCLSCHDNMARYEQVSGHEYPQLVEIHEWLPNQALHFRRVRCIECHTSAKDTLMVSHNILRKEHATRRCVECHSANSILQASLYKYQVTQARTERTGLLASIGGWDSGFSNEYYLIGASRIPFLNLIYAIVLFTTIGGIVVHSIFRILKK